MPLCTVLPSAPVAPVLPVAPAEPVAPVAPAGPTRLTGVGQTPAAFGPEIVQSEVRM